MRFTPLAIIRTATTCFQTRCILRRKIFSATTVFLACVTFSINVPSQTLTPNNPLHTSPPLSTAPNLTKVLPADQAFQLSVNLAANNTIVFNWQIEPGYYLYKKNLGIVLEGKALDPALPAGIVISDEFFGESDVYFDSLTVSVNASGTGNDPKLPEAAQTVSYDLTYQGCAEDRYCYPPIHKTIRVDLP